MISLSSCGVKLQEVLSGLEKERLKHWRYTCTFVAFLNITILYYTILYYTLLYFFFFLSTWGVICWRGKTGKRGIVVGGVAGGGVEEVT